MRKKSVITYALILASVLFITTHCNGRSPFDDLGDQKWEGFLGGGGVCIGSTFIQMQWKLGYATSDHTAFYLTSLATHLNPSLGLMRFIPKYPGYYFHAFLRVPRVKHWNLGLGGGYEFRPHFMVELTAGYSRFTIPNESEEFTNARNQITLFASVNYLFY